MAAGVVTLAGSDVAWPGRGWHVWVDCGGGWTYYAGHLSWVDAITHQRVNAGTRLGLSGGRKGHPGAGLSEGPHLHVGVYFEGKAVDFEGMIG